MVPTQSSGLAPAVSVSVSSLPELGLLTRSHLVTDVLRHSITESLSTCGLWNIMLEVWPSENFIHSALVYLTLCPHGTIFVVLLLSISEISHSSVYIDISWTGIEVVAAFDIAFRQYREIRNSTNFLDSPVLARVAEKQTVQCREQWALLNPSSQRRWFVTLH